jgi:hypothetical protein
MRSCCALVWLAYLLATLAAAAGCDGGGSRSEAARTSARLRFDPLVPAAQVDLFEPLAPRGHDDFSTDERALLHPHGTKACKSGCAISDHPTMDLTVDRFKRLLNDYSREAAGEASRSLETLLYYGRQTQRMLARHGAESLDREHMSRLRSELARTHARVAMRVVDETGRTRVWMPPTRVPLDRRHEFHMETDDVPPPTSSGTVKRVGLDHLWTRL